MAIPTEAHAGIQIMFAKERLPLCASKLGALIWVDHDFGLRLTPPHGAQQSLQSEVGWASSFTVFRLRGRMSKTQYESQNAIWLILHISCNRTSSLKPRREGCRLRLTRLQSIDAQTYPRRAARLPCTGHTATKSGAAGSQWPSPSFTHNALKDITGPICSWSIAANTRLQC